MKSKKIFGLVTLFIFFTHPLQAFADDKIKVIVTILPLAEFVEQVGKNKVEVSVMIPPGTEPHTYEPTPNQLKEVSTADLYVKVGTGLEFELYWLDKLLALNKRMRLCDSSFGVELLEMGDRGQDAHRGHAHGFADPHIWLSPKRVIKMVENIKNILIDIDPANAEFYQNNAAEFANRLLEADGEIKDKLTPFNGRSFLTVHPEWGYLAADYGLKQISMEKEGKELTAQELSQVINLAKKENIHAILLSPQFSQKTAEMMARQIGAKLIVTDALAKDYLKNLRKVADELMNTFQ